VSVSGQAKLMMARFYEASISRFLGADPFDGDAANPQSWNKYTYASNSPLVFIDPLGTDPRSALTVGGLSREGEQFSKGNGVASQRDELPKNPCIDGHCSYALVIAFPVQPERGLESVDGW
jgi:RHS repeat-associated protein